MTPSPRCAFRIIALVVVSLLAPSAARAQAVTDDPPDDNKRIFGIIPNYRTTPTLKDYQPLSASAKFKLGRDDAFDRGTFVLAALFGAEAQLSASTPAFGSGARAYPRYFTASLGDFVIGDFMTDTIFPVVLRQDPRYFRKAEGGRWSRARYALGQIILTHADGGGTQFNFSEVLGNATAVAAANAYYPGTHSLSSNASKLALQLAVDAAANVVKEFAPDLRRR